MINIITGGDDKYIPGIVALYNSFLENCTEPEDTFDCMVCNPNTQQKLKNLGVPTIRVDTKMLGSHLPVTSYWKEKSPEMYMRLMIPHIFGYEQPIWVDADAIIVDKLPKEDLGNYSVGATVSWDWTLASQIDGWLHPKIKYLTAIQAGVYIMQRKNWINEDLTRVCVELMSRSEYTYHYVVQSVLSLALLGNFKIIDYGWNFFAHEKLQPGVKILHYAGVHGLPWDNQAQVNIEHWNKYFNEGKVF